MENYIFEEEYLLEGSDGEEAEGLVLDKLKDYFDGSDFTCISNYPINSKVLASKAYQESAKACAKEIAGILGGRDGIFYWSHVKSQDLQDFYKFVASKFSSSIFKVSRGRIERWNPADIWFTRYEDSFKEFMYKHRDSSLQEMTDDLNERFRLKEIVGISIKENSQGKGIKEVHPVHIADVLVKPRIELDNILDGFQGNMCEVPVNVQLGSEVEDGLLQFQLTDKGLRMQYKDEERGVRVGSTRQTAINFILGKSTAHRIVDQEELKSFVKELFDNSQKLSEILTFIRSIYNDGEVYSANYYLV